MEDKLMIRVIDPVFGREFQLWLVDNDEYRFVAVTQKLVDRRMVWGSWEQVVFWFTGEVNRRMGGKDAKLSQM